MPNSAMNDGIPMHFASREGAVTDDGFATVLVNQKMDNIWANKAYDSDTIRLLTNVIGMVTATENSQFLLTASDPVTDT